MQNTYPKNDPQNETTVKEILLLLFNSKKIIILFTLFSLVISFAYNSFKAPIFESSAKVIIGSYLHTDFNTGQISTIQIQKIKDIQSEVLFNFDTTIQPIGQKFLSINVSNTSMEDAENSIKKLIEFLTARSKEIIDEKIEQDRQSLFIVESEISSTNREINRLFNAESNNDNDTSDVGVDVYLSQKLVNLDSLELKKSLMEKKLNKPNLFEYTKLFGDIKTSERKTSQLRVLILSLIFGIAISILYIFIKLNFIEDQEK